MESANGETSYRVKMLFFVCWGNITVTKLSHIYTIIQYNNEILPYAEYLTLNIRYTGYKPIKTTSVVYFEYKERR